MVSICIPTYNRAATLAKALASAQAQTFADVEIVVVDNHSTDNTEALVHDAARTDPRVRYVRQAENIGLARNFSACISEARRDLVKLLCDDDWLERDCVAMLVAALSRPGVALAACARRLVDDGDQTLRITRARRSSTTVSGEAMLRELFARGNTIGEPSAVLFRKRDAARGFDVRYQHALDLEMWCHLLRGGALAYVAEPLCCVRVHSEQATRANIQSGQIIEDKQRLYREIGPSLAPALSAAERWRWDARMASTVGRMRARGGSPDTSRIAEVFHPRLFRSALLPLATLAWSVTR
jgi:hypothetical protein